MGRKQIRLAGWDYSSEGVYFITICCGDRYEYFGNIKDKRIVYSDVGVVATDFWMQIPVHFQHVKLDEFIIMPNHIHGIIILDYSAVGPRHGVALPTHNQRNVGTCHGMSLQHHDNESDRQINQFSQPVKNSVSVIINQYKSSVKRWCNKNGHSRFKWQSRYYDRILHNEGSIDHIRQYIWNNPENWFMDEFFLK